MRKTLPAHYQGSAATLYDGDCLDVLTKLPDASVDSVVTDPPYGLAFMGNAWDTMGPVDFQRWTERWASECLRVLKPGGYCLAFGGSRTWHRLTAGIEDAGFEIRDSIAWLYGQGFPKSLNVARAIDRQRGTATDEARKWEGWGTALKPAFEPCVVARKPLDGSVAHNVTTYGTGALNIGACRVGADEMLMQGSAGRFPPNVAFDTALAADLDAQSGTLTSGLMPPGTPKAGKARGIYGEMKAQPSTSATYGDTGGASRFFPVFRWQAKAPRSERPNVEGVTHPTVKPLALMRWLVRLVTAPGGVVLGPFAGSGTTLEAAVLEGMKVIGIEREETYLPLIESRLRKSATAALDPSIINETQEN